MSNGSEHRVGWYAPSRTGPDPEARADDRRIRDVLFGISGYPAFLVAYDLKVYPLLAERRRTLREVCEAPHIATRPADLLQQQTSSRSSHSDFLCPRDDARTRSSRRAV